MDCACDCGGCDCGDCDCGGCDWTFADCCNSKCFPLCNNGAPRDPDDVKEGCSYCGWIVAGFIVIAVVIAGVGTSVTGGRSVNRFDDEPNNEPTPAPTVAGSPECAFKRLRITEICDVPDLDDDIFGTDTTMDIKILADDDQYWPKNVSSDCLSAYGSYDGACLIPDTSLIGCFELKNSIEIPVESPPQGSLKITIYDVDIFVDDFIDILIPTGDWYFPNRCDTQTLEFQAESRAARVKMTVYSGENEACGIDTTEIVPALLKTSEEFEKMQTALEGYVTPDPARNLREHRQLFFGALISGARVLVSGVRAFGGLFARGARASSGRLSALADFASIGSALFSAFGPSPGADNNQDQTAIFDEIFERFDQVNQKLDGIQDYLQGGFEAIELVVQEEFAKQELDDWIKGHLAILNDDYRAYMDKDHTAETRGTYEDIFRTSCRSTHSPFTTFKVLYSHACKDCELLDGRSQQYIMDTFVDLAKANFEDLTERVLWFRQSFGTVIIAALTEAIYLHSVCLYQPETVCQNEDPVWVNRLEEMGEALEEVAVSLTEKEPELE